MFLMEQFLHGNIPLMRILNEESQFMFWWRSAIKEVNNWFLNSIFFRSITKSIFLLKTSILENDESLHPAAITATACCTWAFFKSPFQKINFRLFFSLIKCCNNSLLIQSLTVETKCTSFILFFLKEKIQKKKRTRTFHIKKSFPLF